MARLILHIGGQKCGSSALQGYLFHNRKALADAGVHYVDRDFGIDTGRARSHNALLTSLRRWPDAELERKAAALAEAVSDGACIISSEGFCAVTQLDVHAAKLSRACSRFRPEVHLYVRNQLNIIYSGWHQWGLKRGMSFDQWVEHALAIGFADWNRILIAYERALPGTTTFKVHVYDRAVLSDGDIVTDFTSKAAIPMLQGTIARRNPSLNELATQALLEISRERDVDLAELLRQLKGSGPDWAVNGSRNFICSPDTASRIMQHYLAGNEEMFRRYDVPPDHRDRFNSALVPAFAPLHRGEMAETMAAARVYVGAHCH